jgi:hypothetical protein
MTEVVQNKGKRLYFGSLPFMNYVFTDGHLAVFKHYRYATDKPEEIAALDYEVSKGHPYITVKPDQMWLTAEMEDPMKALKAKIIAEYLAEKAAHVNPENNMGVSSQESIKPASTTDIAAVAAGGDATQSAAKLVQLAKTQAMLSSGAQQSK